MPNQTKSSNQSFDGDIPASSSFVGRKEELRSLHSTLDDIRSNLRQQAINKTVVESNIDTKSNENTLLAPITLMHGDSGTGKSALAYKFLGDLKHTTGALDENITNTDQIITLSGKYYESENSSPFCAIITALDDFVNHSISPAESEVLREKVANVLGIPELNVLSAFLPGLSQFFFKPNDDQEEEKDGDFAKDSIFSQDHTRSTVTASSQATSSTSYRPGSSRTSSYLSSSNLSSFVSVAASSIHMEEERSTTSLSIPATNVWNRLKYILYCFLKVIMTDERPIVMFIDDLQWADKESMDFLNSLLSDLSLSNLMFIGTCRESAVGGGVIDPMIEKMMKCKRREIERINMTNFSREDTHAYVLDVLKPIHVETAKKLSERLYSSTGGNVFFVKQSIEDLAEKGYISFSESLLQWVFTDPFQNEFVSVEAKLRGCSRELQQVLIIASFLGDNFDETTIRRISKKVGFEQSAKSISSSLADAVKQGLFSLVEDTHIYSFAHDRIYEASFFLCPLQSRERSDLAMKVGMSLYEMYCSKIGKDWMLLKAANNINSSGAPTMGSLRRAKVNLKAGRYCMSIAAFEIAEGFLFRGVSALRHVDFHWTNHYEMSIILFRALIDTMFYLDKEYEGQLYAKELFIQAKNTDDQLLTYLSIENYNARKDKIVQSLNYVTFISTKIGEFPKGKIGIRAIWGLVYIKRWYHKHSDNDILKLSKVSKKSELNKIKLFTQGFIRAGYCGKTHELVLFTVLGLRISLKYGICGETSLLLNAFTNLSMFALNDFFLAMRFANLSQKVTRMLPVSDATGWAYFAFCSYSFPWSKPADDILLLCQEGYRTGMETGSFEIAFANRFTLTGTAFAAGYPLALMAKCFEDSINQLGIYDVQLTLTQTDEYRRMVYCLIEQQELDWKDLESFGPDKDIESDPHRLVSGYFMRMLLGVFFNKYVFAKQMAKKCAAIMKENLSLKMHFMEVARCYFTFLVETGLFHRTGNKKHKKKAMKIAKMTMSCLKQRGETSRHIELLMEAELFPLRNRNATTAQIQSIYNGAIIAALESRHTHYAALGLELVGEHMVRKEEDQLAARYFCRARDCYEEWGARAKVVHVEQSRAVYINLSKQQVDCPGTIPSLTNYFEENRKSYRFDILSFDFRVSQSEKKGLFDRLDQGTLSGKNSGKQQKSRTGLNTFLH